MEHQMETVYAGAYSEQLLLLWSSIPGIGYTHTHTPPAPIVGVSFGQCCYCVAHISCMPKIHLLRRVKVPHCPSGAQGCSRVLP